MFGGVIYATGKCDPLESLNVLKSDSKKFYVVLFTSAQLVTTN